MTDSGGVVKQRRDFMPFGEEILANATFGNRHQVTDGGVTTYNTVSGPTQQFTGKERDAETGLDYFRARYMSSAQGRFVSPDSPFADQNTLNPQSWNLYTYGLNNPSVFVDDTGRGAIRAVVRDAAEHAALQLARRRGVDRAWAFEKKLVETGGDTTQRWTRAERDAILAGKTPDGWIAHHINNVADHSIEMAENPNNIKFVKGIAAHKTEHNGSFLNKTVGELIDRVARMGGPSLALFLSLYEANVSKLTKDCKVCSDPDSKASFLNPANAMVENLALFEAFATLENEKKKRADRASTEAERQCALGNPAACGN